MCLPACHKRRHAHADDEAADAGTQRGRVIRVPHNTAQALKQQALKAQHENAVRQSREAVLRSGLANRRAATMQMHSHNTPTGADPPSTVETTSAYRVRSSWA